MRERERESKSKARGAHNPRERERVESVVVGRSFLSLVRHRSETAENERPDSTPTTHTLPRRKKTVPEDDPTTGVNNNNILDCEGFFVNSRGGGEGKQIMSALRRCVLDRGFWKLLLVV